MRSGAGRGRGELMVGGSARANRSEARKSLRRNTFRECRHYAIPAHPRHRPIHAMTFRAHSYHYRLA